MDEWRSSDVFSQAAVNNNNSFPMPRPSGSRPAAARSPAAKSKNKQDELAEFVARWSLPEPEYKTISDGTGAPVRGRGRGRGGGSSSRPEYFGQVTIGTKKFLTAPHTFPSENEAREVVAGKALESLQKDEALAERKANDGPDDPHQAHFLVEQILDIVKDTPQGLHGSSIEEEYLRRHNKLLPDYWLEVIRSTDSQLQLQETHYNRSITIVSLKPLPVTQYKKNWIDPSDYFEAVVTRIISPDDFWIQNREIADPAGNGLYAAHPHSEDFKQLIKEMDDYYTKSGSFFKITKADIVKDKIMAGKILKSDGSVSWQRIQIHDCNELDEITGLLVDHGSCMQFNMRDIQPLPPSLYLLPKQAQRAALSGIQPIGDHWSDQEIETFRQIVSNKPFMALVVSAQEGLLKIKLLDVSQEDDIDIASLMIDRKAGRAIAVAEA